MEKKKLNRIIEILREEMMTANPVGGQGGYGSNPDKKGVAGFDPLLGKKKRKKRIVVWSSSLRKNGES